MPYETVVELEPGRKPAKLGYFPEFGIFRVEPPRAARSAGLDVVFDIDPVQIFKELCHAQVLKKSYEDRIEDTANPMNLRQLRTAHRNLEACGQRIAITEHAIRMMADHGIPTQSPDFSGVEPATLNQETSCFSE